MGYTILTFLVNAQRFSFYIDTPFIIESDHVYVYIISVSLLGGEKSVY